MHVPLSVQFGREAVMPYGWEGNRRFGVCSNLKPAQLPEQLTFLEYKAFRRITVSIPPARSCFFYRATLCWRGVSRRQAFVRSVYVWSQV